MKKFFSFAFADSMLDQNKSFTLLRQPCPAEEIAKQTDLISALNPSHKATVDAMISRYNFSNIEIPSSAPTIKLEVGDVLFLLTTRGLPRLEGTRQYSEDEIAKATFTFSKYTIMTA